MPERYARPPLKEAVCEYRFDPSAAWDVSASDAIFGRLQHQLPVRERSKNVQGRTTATGTEVAHQIEVAEGARFVSDDGRAFVQVFPHRLSVHRLAPYTSWEVFKPLISAARDAYVNAIHPAAIARIGLRYVNDVRLPAGDVSLERYFEFFPKLGPRLPQNFFAFTCTTSFQLSDEDALRISLTDAGVNEGAAVRVDLDYFSVKAGSVSLETDAVWLEKAHAAVGEAFEGTITDQARDLFEPIGGDRA